MRSDPRETAHDHARFVIEAFTEDHEDIKMTYVQWRDLCELIEKEILLCLEDTNA
jgi:hypothetical protein